MPTSEKFCLRWNDFQENVNTAFRDLRKDSDFTDVTLACEDGHQIEAHKVILASSSPVFQNLLKRNKHAHPLIYKRGMKSEDLLAIVDFLCYGEADIYQEYLDSFLNLAEELKLKGLNGAEGGGGEGAEVGTNPQKQTNKPIDQSMGRNGKNNTIQTQYPTNFEDQITPSMNVAHPKHDWSGDMNELDGKIQSMIGRGDNMVRLSSNRMIKAYVCKVCGKEGVHTNITNHIETNHIDGISLLCNICNKTFMSRASLRKHTSTKHIQGSVLN